MSVTKNRLETCFTAVFPMLDAADISTASNENTEGWDSVASITLFMVIEEEFGVHVPEDELATLTSFETIFRWLSKNIADE